MADGPGGSVTDGGGTVVPVFGHLDDADVPWRPVRSVRRADGSTASMREPFVAGPSGVIIFEVMMGGPRTWGVDPDAFRATLDRPGGKPLPDPERDLPEWLVDLRGRWVVDGEELEVSPSSDLPPA